MNFANQQKNEIEIEYNLLMTTKIFIGTSPNSYDLEIEMIYEYSLRKHSTTELDINWMKLSNDSNDFWETGKQINGLLHLVALDGVFLSFVISVGELYIRMLI